MIQSFSDHAGSPSMPTPFSVKVGVPLTPREHPNFQEARVASSNGPSYAIPAMNSSTEMPTVCCAIVASLLTTAFWL